MRGRYAWGLGIPLLLGCSTDSFGNDAGGDGSSSDVVTSDVVGSDTLPPAEAGGADAASGDASGPPCDFDGGVIRPSMCGVTCTPNTGNALDHCCVDVDASSDYCTSSTCAGGDESFQCVVPGDCVVGDRCCFAAAVNLLTCPHRMDESKPASSSCNGACPTGAFRACDSSNPCPTGFKCAAALLPGFLETGLCI